MSPFLINAFVLNESKKIVTIDKLKKAQAVMILGAQVYSNGRVSDILYDRMITAFKVYESGKAEKILISGDHGQIGYDEVNTMKKYFLDWGVSPEDIYMDHAGFSTYESMYRAKEIFQINTMIISTQEFHLPRSLFLANAQGITSQGIIADRQRYLGQIKNETREFLARVKDFFMALLMKPKPKYLGDSIPINGDGRATWD